MHLLEGAYLPDPTEEWSKRLNPEVVPASYFEDRPCVVLLGDAAMGKTTAMMQVERAAADARIVTSGGDPVRESLGRFGSDTLLVDDVFRSSVLANLDHRDHPVHLFLDDFDECLLRIPTLPKILIHELQRWSPEAIRRKLRLRIICRTSVWPDGLTAKLQEFWGESGVDVFELAPLRLKDVRLAASETSVDPEAFVADVRRCGAAGFAARPLTLRMLLRRFSRGERLSTSQAEIFEDACLELCAAFDYGEFGREREARLSPRERLTVAGRIAAAAMFSGREFVDRQWAATEEPSGDVALQELIGQETTDGRIIQVGEVELEEVLHTGLFAGAGAKSERRRWAHRAYAEFLAAGYLVRRGVSLAQVRSLVVHPDDPDGHLVPALHETAAWLAGQRADVFEDILIRDPTVLLSTDLVGIEPEFRARLVDALLSRYGAGELLEPDWAMRDRFRNLAHPGLGQQLGPWIRDASRSRLVRTVAIDIAQWCRETAVMGDLVRIALDSRDNVRVRTIAASAVAEYGDPAAKAALAPLVAGDPNDPEDQIKGCALKATWPYHLSAAELFDVLTVSRPNFLGSYRSFLYDNPIKDLQQEDIPIALAWVDRHLGPAELPHDIEDLVTSILRMAAKALDDPAVAEAFGPLSWRHLSSQHRVLDWSTYSRLHGEAFRADIDDADRRAIVEVLVRSAIACQARVQDLAYAQLVVPADVPWLLDQVSEAEDESLHRAWARVVDSVLRIDNEDHLAAVRSVGLTDPILYAETERWQDPEELARRAAEIERLMRDWEERDAADAPRLDPPSAERVTRLLDAFATGDINAWWQLNLVLTLEPTSTHYGNEYEPDLTTLPGWQAADEPTRERIIDAAMTYVRQHLPEPDVWLASNTIFRPDWAGYRALHLLWRIAPNCLHELDPDVWRRWGPVVVGFPTLKGTGDQAPQQALVRMAYADAPEEVLATLDRLLRAADESARFDAEHELRKVIECWDDRLAETLRRLLTEPQLPARVAGAILTTLLAYDDAPAKELAAGWVAGPPQAGIARERALEAAHALIAGARELGWERVWTAIQADPDFGEHTFARLIWRDSFADEMGGWLSVPQLASLYALLERRYPESGDPNELGIHEVTFREQIGRWRDGVLVQIARHGSTEAVEALRALAMDFPELEKIQRTLVRATEVARATTWRPPSPGEVLALAETQEFRLVHNADQLLDAVVESLARLQHRLQDEESRAVVDLWSVVGRSTIRGIAKGVLANLRGQLVKGREDLRSYFRIEDYWKQFRGSTGVVMIPKNELLLSDYIKRHLDADLARSRVIVNREVQNRKGDITDIRVQAFAQDEQGRLFDPLTVIVEVKGCWHPDLETAMINQLVDRYLQPASLRHGLYLIGWFNVEAWDPSDRRRQRAAKFEFEPLQQRMNEQADGLVQRGLVVRSVILDASLPSDAGLEPPAGTDE